MATSKWMTGVVCAAIAALGALAACSGEDGGGPGSGSGASHAGGNASGAGGTGGELWTGTGGTSAVASIEITPQDPVVEIVDGVATPITFTAVGKTANGDDVPVSGAWSFDRLDVAGINAAAGTFTPTGFVGGTGTVTFDTGTATGTTSATVKLHLTSDPEAVDPGIKAAFEAAVQPDPSLVLLYPYDKTVFPRGLAGPTLQWNGAGPSDVYYVHAVSPTFEFEAWATAPLSRYDLPTAPVDAWRKLTDSTSGTIDIAIQRYDGAVAYQPVTQSWTIAPANLAGSVYFWEINQGNVVRLKMGQPAPENFLQKPPGVTCVACHSVAKGGSRIVAAFHGGASPWATFDAASGALIYDSGQPSGFEAISPDGGHVLYRHWNGAMTTDGHLILSTSDNATALAYLDPGGGGPSHPEWSPDGGRIAFSVRSEPGGLYFANSNLWIAGVDVGNNLFFDVHQIVANDPTNTVLTYPTFAPDSHWIAFMRGNYSYCDAGAVGFPVYGDIWLTDVDGSAQIPLDALNGGAHLGAAEQRLNYQPNFLPVAVGGYMWLVFSTERTYGNILTDTNATARRKQLWVSAINLSPQPGQDPSHPPFWLPGQQTNNENMRGQWALDPCKEQGNPCEAGYECCSGLICQDDGNGNKTCEVPDPDDCIPNGSAGCQSPADCCDPDASCVGGYCVEPPPG